MKSLSIRDFRSCVGNLTQLVEESGEIIVTRHGEPILRILPIHAKLNRPLHQDLRKKMPLLKKPSSQLIREDRDER